MKARILNLLKSPSTRAFLALTAVYAVAMAVIFWGTWSLDRAPVEPDNPTTYPIDYAAKWLSSLLAGGNFVPGDLRNLLGSPYFWQELQYAVPCFLAALAVVFYLRGRGLSLVASYGAGAAYGLMGYNITLFSAGHLGWFVWLAYGPFAFGLIDRCVRKGGWANWIFLGAVLAWGAARQPDLWLLFTLLSFFYGIWSVVVNRKLASSGTWLGTCVTAAVLFVCGWPQLERAIFTETANRDKQIAGVTGDAAASGAESPAKERTKEEESRRWDFCTSWSLPPDEIVEFFADSSKGDSSDPRVSPSNRYKGRIGQRVTIPEGQRARDPSTGRIVSGGELLFIPYRQHSLYFGFITCLLALVGVLSPLMRRIGGRAGRAPLSGDDAAADRDILFWTAAAAVCLLCALGGFTPFYRLVYALPMGDYIRCPVKFVHLVELCAAVLAGFGLEALLGFAKGRGWAKVAVPALAVLSLVNVVDLTRVDRRYLAVEDVSFARAPNAAAEAVRAAGGGKTFLAVDPAEGREAMATSFGAHLVETLPADAASSARFVFATQRGLAASPALGEMLRAGRLKMAGAYAWSRERGVYSAPQNAAGAALFQVDGVEAPAPEQKPVPNRRAQFFTWLSIACSFGVMLVVIARILAGIRKDSSDM